MTHIKSATISKAGFTVFIELDDDTLVYLCPSQIRAIAAQLNDSVAFPRIKPPTQAELFELLKVPEFAHLDEGRAA